MASIRITRPNTIFLWIAILVILSCHSTSSTCQSCTTDSVNSRESLPRPISAEPHPYTVEPGQIDFEFHPFTYSYNRHRSNGEVMQTRQISSSIRMKVGILHDMDYQIGLDLFDWEENKKLQSNSFIREQGLGDLLLSLKWNLWGNEQDTNSAFSIMPFVQLPTARHNLGRQAIQGGILFPLAFSSTDKFEVEWTPHLAAIRDSVDEQYEMEVGSLLTINRNLIWDELEVFLEFEAVVDSENHSSWYGALSPGFSYQATPKVVLEAGAIFGLTRAADDVAGYLTVVVRF